MRMRIFMKTDKRQDAAVRNCFRQVDWQRTEISKPHQGFFDSAGLEAKLRAADRNDGGAHRRRNGTEPEPDDEEEPQESDSAEPEEESRRKRLHGILDRVIHRSYGVMDGLIDASEHRSEAMDSAPTGYTEPYVIKWPDGTTQQTWLKPVRALDVF